MAMSRRSTPPPPVCPTCGADVPTNALACPECGADHETGWNQEAAVYDAIDLPDQEFDHDEYVKRELGETTPATREGTGRLVKMAFALVCIVVLVLWMLSL